MSGVLQDPQIMANIDVSPHHDTSQFPSVFMELFVWVYILMGTLTAALAILNILSARFISLRINRTFTLIVAGINCLQLPFGTALGVFTFMTLTKNSIRNSYDYSADQ